MTPQYAGLRTLHEDNADAGFAVLAFPCNQFGAQEPGTDAEVLEFATSNYDVTFPMFSKIEVNGDGAAPLYDFLKADAPGDDDHGDITWNFAKFLVGRDGHVIARFDPQVTPEEIAEILPQHL
ncbi:MAG: glutathione peroxidase [Acidimicrobiales bacterium]